MNFIEKIIEEMEIKNVNAAKMCRDLNIGKNTFSQWKKGHMPSVDKAALIVKYLGISLDEIFELSENSSLSENEKEMLDYFRKLPDREQMRELGRLEALAMQHSAESESTKSKTG